MPSQSKSRFNGFPVANGPVYLFKSSLIAFNDMNTEGQQSNHMPEINLASLNADQAGQALLLLLRADQARAAAETRQVAALVHVLAAHLQATNAAITRLAAVLEASVVVIRPPN